jgi:centractin
MATDFDEKEIYIGRRAQELRGLLKIKWPVEHGIVSLLYRTNYRERSVFPTIVIVQFLCQVTDWDDMERIWNYVYREGLGTASEEVSLFVWTSRFDDC